jgi:hypothetical protein
MPMFDPAAKAAFVVFAGGSTSLASVKVPPDSVNTAPLRLLMPVWPTATPGGGQPSAWQSELESRVDPAAEPWVTLAREAAEITAQRHRLQAATVALRNMVRPGNTSRTGTVTRQGTITR